MTKEHGNDIILSSKVLLLAPLGIKELFPDFIAFVGFLLNIGLIRLVEARGKEQSYQFAEIYASGFNMRGTRKY